MGVAPLEKPALSEKLTEISLRRFLGTRSFPQSIHPTTCLRIQRQTAHTIAVSVTCIPPSVEETMVRLEESPGEPAPPPPTYLAGAGGAAGRCVGATHGRAAAHKHLSTSTGPRTWRRPLSFSKESIRQEQVTPGFRPPEWSGPPRKEGRPQCPFATWLARRNVPVEVILGRRIEDPFQKLINMSLKFCSEANDCPKNAKIKFVTVN